MLDVEAARLAVPDPWSLVRPAFSYVPEWDYTHGPEVADLCALLRFEPDPEQELILDCAFGMRDGLPAASTGTVIASRQTVKSSGLEMVVLGWAFITREPLVLWTAHEVKTARETFLHLQELIEGNPFARRRVRRFTTGIGDLGWTMTDGRRVMFAARTTEAGRGKTAPKMIRDEELETRDEQLAASKAVTSTFPWAQTLTGSSGAKDYSEVLHRQIRRGRQGLPGRYFHLEWVDDQAGSCADGECLHAQDAVGCRLDDPLRLRASNPTVGRIRTSGRGLTWEALEEERHDLAPAKFARERLGWHDELRADLAAEVFSEEQIKAILDPSSVIVGEPVFALDVAPLREWSSVVAGGRRADGLVHVETTSQPGVPDRVWNHRPGTGWVVGWFRSRLDVEDSTTPTYERMRVLVLAGSEAMALVPALEKLTGLTVDVLPEREWPAACGQVVDAVSGERLRITDAVLADAARSVRLPKPAERARGWTRVGSDRDISPWVALTLLWRHFDSGADYDVLDSIG